MTEARKDYSESGYSISRWEIIMAKKQYKSQKAVIYRSRSQRQMLASSHTAIRILLSLLKLVCRIAAAHFGWVRVVHLLKKLSIKFLWKKESILDNVEKELNVLNFILRSHLPTTSLNTMAKHKIHQDLMNLKKWILV